ncbi:hypothetical protein AA0Y32_12940 [Georgenia phoenicis]|uniref:hypothetical protein n=1 Tax=unclassified Georgenia TaxID=2626815 RepID=UPI0039AF476A
MSTSGPARRPARPSAAVYRRRRLVALLLLLLVVAGVVWGVTALLGSRDATPAATADPTEESTGAPEPSPGEVAACEGADVEADFAIEPTAAEVGAEVTVRNTGDAPCLLDAGPGTLVASVTSGNDAVWSSAHCAGDATNKLLLDAGGTTPVTVTWDGHRSAEGCPGGQPQAGPGTYRLALELAGDPLGTEAFTLG